MATDALDKKPSFLRALADQAAIVFMSSLAVQAATFLVVALSGLLLSTEEFARLSIITASATLATLALEFGLNVTMIKKFGESSKDEYLLAPLAVRLLIAPVAATAGVALGIAGAEEIGLGVFLGAALNFWNGARATNQAQQDYTSYARSSIQFGVVRVLAGLATLVATRDALIIAIAIYAVPVVVIAVPSALRLSKKAFASLSRPSSASAGYAAQIYINQLAFSALPYAPLFFIEARLPTADVARYGLTLAFLAPVTLAITSLRAAVLPKLVAPGSSLEEWLWSRKAVLTMLGLGALLLLAGMGAAIVVEAIYHTRYPGIWAPFLTLFFATAATGLVGLYGLSVHTQNAPHLLVIVNVARLSVLIPMIAGLGTSLTAIAQITGAVMVAGEIALLLLLRFRPR
jgi:O-antigen/teichoic acid export membrane protein